MDGGHGALRGDLRQPQPVLVASDILESIILGQSGRKGHREGGSWGCWAWRRMGNTSLGPANFSAGESLPQEPGPGPPAHRPASLQAGAWPTVPGDAGCASGCGEHGRRSPPTVECQ